MHQRVHNITKRITTEQELRSVQQYEMTKKTYNSAKKAGRVAYKELAVASFKKIPIAVRNILKSRLWKPFLIEWKPNLDKKPVVHVGRMKPLYEGIYSREEILATLAKVS